MIENDVIDMNRECVYHDFWNNLSLKMKMNGYTDYKTKEINDENKFCTELFKRKVLKLLLTILMIEMVYHSKKIC